MDSTANDFYCDGNGICNYCREFEQIINNSRKSNGGDHAAKFLSEVQNHGKSKPYDCVVGVSGGVDSSWTLVKCVENGLRPLAVHMDNGWNSELAQNNIETLVKKLGVDLYTHVINWEEYRGMMQCFFESDVIDIELLYDNAMLAVNYRAASAHGVRYILSGSNSATEGMRMPSSWNWFKYDGTNIKSIVRAHYGPKIKTFPVLDLTKYLFYAKVKKVEWISALDILDDYNKSTATNALQARFGFKPYPYKHYESVFTRFYQGYILPRKFGVDKRKLHLSTLIMTNQLQRAEAIKILADPPFISEAALASDMQYFLKKMQWEPKVLIDYLRRPERRHDLYASDTSLLKNLQKARRLKNSLKNIFNM
jgi:N-acetyl sugar amidotransferase